MLVLTRKMSEKIVIGTEQEICITVVSVQGGRVKLGIEADPTIPIQRAELEAVPASLPRCDVGESSSAPNVATPL